MVKNYRSDTRPAKGARHSGHKRARRYHRRPTPEEVLASLLLYSPPDTWKGDNDHDRTSDNTDHPVRDRGEEA